VVQLPDAGDAVMLTGRHVSVNVPHRRHVHEAIEELYRTEKDLPRHLPAD